MSTEIIFKDLFGKRLTKQQVAAYNDDYDEEIYIDGKLKQVNTYEDRELLRGEYYLSPEESLQTIINLYKDKWRFGQYYTLTSEIGAYTVKEWELYRGLLKVGEGKYVYDNSERITAKEILDINSQQIKHTNKYCYLSNVGNFKDSGDVRDFGVLEFQYNNGVEGRITVQVNLPGFNHKGYFITSVENILLNHMILPLFFWTNETYYHSAKPLIPSRLE